MLDGIIQQMNDFPKVSSNVTCKIFRIRKWETTKDSTIDLFMEAMHSKDMTSHNNNLVLSHWGLKLPASNSMQVKEKLEQIYRCKICFLNITQCSLHWLFTKRGNGFLCQIGNIKHDIIIIMPYHLYVNRHGSCLILSIWHNSFYLFFFFFLDTARETCVHTYIPAYRYMYTTMQVPEGISTDDHLWSSQLL